MDPAPFAHREVCLLCRRPRAVCYCGALTPAASRTRVVFLQHPREARVPISTCRMAHLSLPNSELHIGLRAAGNPALEALAGRPGVAVLFPGETATDIETLAAPPEVLVVVDGTWSTAKKVVQGCPVLSKLPRLEFRPDAPGNYRIRREPEAHFLSTIEATAHVLERLERRHGEPGRFSAILTAFDAMVERQLDWARRNTGPSRHQSRKPRRRTSGGPLAVLRGRELVVIFGEVNAWPMSEPNRPEPDRPELLHLVAERLSTGERFARLLQPVRPLGPRVAEHLRLSVDELQRGEPRAEVLDAWRRFVRPDDLFLGWGPYCRDLLAGEGVAPPEFVDVRPLVCSLARRSPGSVEDFAESLGHVRPAGVGRALYRAAALAFVTRAALAGSVVRAASAAPARHAVAVSLFLGCALAPLGPAHAEPEKPWSVRVSMGVGFIEAEGATPDGAHLGVGGAAELLWAWTATWRLGVGYELERYTWSGYGSALYSWSDVGPDMPPPEDTRFLDEWLVDQRALLLLRWDPLAPTRISPFLMMGLGAAKENASVHSVQCTPHNPFGPAAEAALGADAELWPGLRMGLDWRVATPAIALKSCTAAYLFGEPPDPPSGLRHRLLLAVTFADLF